MNKTITITKVLTDIEIMHVNVNFLGLKHVQYKEVFQDGSFNVKIHELTQEEYDGWGTDDNYIKQLIANKY